MGEPQSCARCGGPHQFDTSVPSPLWNRVIRDKGWPEYLCTTCIVLLFVRAGESFEAELFGGAVDRPDGVVPLIRVQVADRPLDESYGDLQAQLREARADCETRLAALDAEIARRRAPDYHWFAKRPNAAPSERAGAAAANAMQHGELTGLVIARGILRAALAADPEPSDV